MIKYIDKFNSFKDFYVIVKNLKAKEKGDLFEELTKYIFMFHDEFIDTTKEIWLLKDVPLNILGQLNLPLKDYGIDLIMKDSDGLFHPIQSKFRMNTETVVDWKELSTFFGLSFGVATGFGKGYFVTNTRKITQNAIRSKVITSKYDRFIEDLPDTFFAKLKNYLKPAIKNIIQVRKPWPHQQEIISKTVEHFKEFDRGNVIMACGTGKTLTSYWIDKEMHNSVVIVAVPSLYLLSQMHGDWSAQMASEKRKYNFILIGSDADYDEAKCDFKHLLLTTNTDEIAKKLTYLMKQKKILKTCIITTYQSADRLVAALKQTNITPNMCIFDEAHKTVGQKDKQFSLLLDDNIIKIDNRLFMTATQRYFNGNDDNILSMDDVNWYGQNIATFNTSSAIKNGLLVDYQIVMMYINDEYIEKFVKENKFAWYNNKIIDAQQLATAIMLVKEFQQGNCHHLVTYHNSIKSSKNFRELLENLIKSLGLVINVFDVDGTHSMSMRNRIFRCFTNAKNAIIVSARVLNEGINIPIIDAVCFVDPRMSIIDIIQSAGRAFRLFFGKDMAKIYVPIVLNGEVDIENDNIFGNVVTVLRALSTTDDDIVEYFSALKNGKVMTRKVVKHVAYIEKKNTVVEVGEAVDISNWLRGIDMRIWEKINPWNCTYEKVKLWIETVGHKMPTKKNPDKIIKYYGEWCANICVSKKNNKLSDDKIAKLELIKGWKWTVERIDYVPKTFDERYEELLIWIQTHDNKLPTKNLKDEIEKDLGFWCITQRQCYVKEKLSEERKIKLELIPNWFWVQVDPFYETYENLLKFMTGNNNTLPKSGSKNKTECSLANWIGRQKVLYKKGTLGDDKIKKLEVLNNWKWIDTTIVVENKLFDIRYEEVKLWISTHNNNIPNTRSEDKTEENYGNWCKTHRQSYVKGNLSEESKNKLELIPSWYWKKPDKFYKTYDNLLQFMANNNNILPKDNSQNKIETSLSAWIGYQKASHKKGILSDDKIKLLEVLNNWKWMNTNIVIEFKSFDIRYEEIVQWLYLHNNYPNTESKNKLEKTLGRWCCQQRLYYSKNTLSEYRINNLNALANWTWKVDRKLLYKKYEIVKNDI